MCCREKRDSFIFIFCHGEGANYSQISNCFLFCLHALKKEFERGYLDAGYCFLFNISVFACFPSNSNGISIYRSKNEEKKQPPKTKFYCDSEYFKHSVIALCNNVYLFRIKYPSASEGTPIGIDFKSGRIPIQASVSG